MSCCRVHEFVVNLPSAGGEESDAIELEGGGSVERNWDAIELEGGGSVERNWDAIELEGGGSVPPAIPAITQRTRTYNKEKA